MARRPHRLIGLALAVVVALAACVDVRAAEPVKTPVVVHVERGGFHWSDAGIGALAGVGLSLTVCGCLALARLRGAETTPQRKGEHHT